MKDKHSETLRNPIIPINLLTLENLLDINEGIKTDSKRDRRIEYSGSEDWVILNKQV